jgi:hypothetical protein
MDSIVHEASLSESDRALSRSRRLAATRSDDPSLAIARNRAPASGRCAPGGAKGKNKRLLNILLLRRDFRQADGALQLSHDWLRRLVSAQSKENAAFRGTRGAAAPAGGGRAGRVRKDGRA